ncbi:MAG TPA: hypothetical protein VN927_06400 [Gemmatimonadaceae bacterium]|nr:hypothetical protein [Gemmatimonadaceae bacterium]
MSTSFTLTTLSAIAGTGNRFETEQDCVGLGLAREVVEHIAPIRISAIAKRDEFREDDPPRLGPGHTLIRASGINTWMSAIDRHSPPGISR